MMQCKCGRRLSMDYVALVDECPNCGASPIPLREQEEAA